MTQRLLCIAILIIETTTCTLLSSVPPDCFKTASTCLLSCYGPERDSPDSPVMIFDLSIPLQTPAMSAIQIFRAVLKAIAEPKTFKNGVFMGRQDPAGATTPPAAGIFRQHFKCQLVDPSGWSNAMAHLSPAVLKQACSCFCPHPTAQDCNVIITFLTGKFATEGSTCEHLQI